MQGSEQGFLTVVPAPRPALSRSCPSGGALLGAQPHSVFPRAPGPLEGPRTRSLWREGPSEPCTLPHKHALTSTLVCQARAMPSQVSAAPTFAGLPPGSGPRLAGRGCQHGLPGGQRLLPCGQPGPSQVPSSAARCQAPPPLLGARWGPHWEQSLQCQAQPSAPVATWRRGHSSAHGWRPSPALAACAPPPPAPAACAPGRALRGRSGSSQRGPRVLTVRALVLGHLLLGQLA